jgi:hypothetical protein
VPEERCDERRHTKQHDEECDSFQNHPVPGHWLPLGKVVSGNFLGYYSTYLTNMSSTI